MFNLLCENSIIIMVHDTSHSDAATFREKFGNLLPSAHRDCTVDINDAFHQLDLHCMTTTYTSSLKFPTLNDDDWQKLYHIKQADYDNQYSDFSHELLITKNLIDFVISDKLEAFSESERNKILNEFHEYLIQHNYQLNSTCKIQVALTPKHTLECEKEFLQLKDKIEIQKKPKPVSPVSLAYTGTLYNRQPALSQTEIQEKPSVELKF